MGLNKRISYLMLDKLSGKELETVYAKARAVREEQRRRQREAEAAAEAERRRVYEVQRA